MIHRSSGKLFLVIIVVEFAIFNRPQFHIRNIIFPLLNWRIFLLSLGIFLGIHNFSLSHLGKCLLFDYFGRCSFFVVLMLCGFWRLLGHLSHNFLLHIDRFFCYLVFLYFIKFIILILHGPNSLRLRLD